MTPGEQLACEWEARHDVAARARRSDPAALQHYISHLRCTEPAHAHDEHTPPARERREPDPHPLVHQWLRWGEEPARSQPEGRRLTDAG
jgi:hypothetical protein